jgi:hypothetical protein
MSFDELDKALGYGPTNPAIDAAKQAQATEEAERQAQLEKAIAERGGPITHEQRMILQNIFDVDKGRRGAYLKQLGYEINPQDDNQYKVPGSETYYDIDPGFGAYFKKGGLAELGRDTFTDMGFDFATSALVGAGTAFGAGVGAPTGPLAIGAAMLGGAAGSMIANETKEGIGTMLLEAKVEPDQHAKLVSVAFDTLMPVIGKGIGKGMTAFKQSSIKSRMDAIVNASKSAGGQLDEKLLKRAIEEPELFTNDAVDGASKKLRNEYKTLFGVEEGVMRKLDPEDIAVDSLFGRKMMPIVGERNAEVLKLAKDPRASFDIKEIGKPLFDTKAALEGKKFLDADEEAALRYVNSKIEDMSKKLKKISVPTPEGKLTAQERLNFSDAYDLVKSIQKDAFQREGAGSSIIKQVVGGGDGQMNAVLKSKASPKFIESQDVLSNLIDVHQKASRTITPTSMTSAFLGADSPQKQAVQEAFSLVDETLGVNMSQSIQDKTMQRTVENLYKNPKAFGSGRLQGGTACEFMMGAVEGGGKGGAAGMAAGAALGSPGFGALIGGTAGAAVGGTRRAMDAINFSRPEEAVQKLIQLGQQSSAVEEFAKRTGQDMTKALPPLGAISGGVTTSQLGTAPISALKQLLVDKVASGEMTPQQAQAAEDEFNKRLGIAPMTPAQPQKQSQ